MVAYTVARTYPGQDGHTHYLSAGAFESLTGAHQLTHSLNHAWLQEQPRSTGSYVTVPIAKWRKLSREGVAK